MKPLTLCLVVCYFSHFIVCERIVVLAPRIPRSHIYSLQPVIEELADRGHRVTVVASYPPTKNHTNIRNIILSDLVPGVETQYSNFKRTSLLTLLLSAPMIAQSILAEGYDSLLNNDTFRQLVFDRDADLVLLDSIWQDFALPAIDHLRVPLVYYCSASPPFPWTLDVMGASQDYANSPVGWTDYGRGMTFWQRLVNALTGEYLILFYRWYMMRLVDDLGKRDFPNARPSIEVARSADLCLVNHHAATSRPRSFPPNFVSVGAMHVRPTKPLPSEFQTFADESTDGFAVFTLGSNALVSSLPDKFVETFVEVFARLPLRIVWKWEKKNLPADRLSNNILVSDWLPQQDLLGHRNARLFISHGGLLGIQEALYHGIPILGLPLGRDQPLNLVRAEEEGYGILLHWEDVSESVLESSILKILTDKRYSENATRLSAMMHDELVPTREMAAHSIERVLRYGSVNYQTMQEARNLPFYKAYLFDVWLFVAVVATIILFLFYRATSFFYRVARDLICRLTGSRKIKVN